MSITVAELVARLRADTSDFDRGMRNAGDSVDDMGRRVEGGSGKIAALAKMAAVTGVAALVAFGVKAVMAGSNLMETLSKVGVVFGDSSKDVEKFANKMASDFGAPKQAVLDAVAMFGLLGKAAGQSQPEAAKMSKELAKLAMDASSFHNVPLDVALEKIRAGLSGEAEPLKAFGVLMNDASMKAKALEMGLGGVKGELTEGEKVIVRSALITEGLKDAQGDLERTSGSLANRMKALQGRATNFAADVGMKLIPVILKAWDLFDEGSAMIKRALMPVLKELGDFMKNTVAPAFQTVMDVGKMVIGVLFGGDFKGGGPFEEDSPFVNALFIIRDWFKEMPARMAPVIDLFKSIGEFIRTNIGPAIEFLAGVATERFNQIKAVVVALVEGLQVRFQIAMEVMGELARTIDEKTKDIQDIFKALLDIAGSIFTILQQVIKAAFIVIVGIFMASTAILQEVWDRFGGVILAVVGTVFGTLIEVIRGVMNTIKGIFDIFAGLFTGDWGRMWDGVKAIFDGIWDVIVGVFRGILELIPTLIRGAVGVINAAFDLVVAGIKAIIGGVVGFISDRVGDIVGFFLGLPGRLVGAAGDLFGFLKNRITDAKNWISDRVNDIVNFIKSIPGKIANVGKEILDKITPDVGSIPVIGGALKKLGSLNPFAKGGNIGAGEVGLVGERGPEIFVPKVPGIIVPNSEITGGSRGNVSLPMSAGGGGGGTTMTVNLHVGGSIISEGDLMNQLYDGLKQIQRYRGNLQFAER